MKSVMEYEIKPNKRTRIDLPELWTFRELFYFFTWRDVKIKYKQTVLGALWAILQPFLLMVVFTLFFSKALKIEHGLLPYPVFVYSGLMLWTIFSTGVANAGNSMVSNANIIKKVYFPRLIIPISSIISTLVDFAMTFILFVGLLLYYHTPVSFSHLCIALPLGVLITLTTTIGLGTFLAALNVRFRDFRYVIPFMIQVLLFLTPVIYPITFIPPGFLHDLLQLNPLSGAIETFRSALTGSAFNWTLIGKSMGVSFILFIIGLAYFKKTEYNFADLA